MIPGVANQPWVLHLAAVACGTSRSLQQVLRLRGSRWYASPRGSDGAAQAKVNPALLKALPFSVSLPDAESSFWRFQRTNPFLAEPSSYDQVKETFLPFWLVHLVVAARATQAQVGHRVAVSRRNPSTQRNEMVWETQWSVVRAAYQRQAVYLPELADMQIPATHKYLSSDLAMLRPGELVGVGEGLGLLKPITAAGMLTASRRVVPFSVRPADARAQALEWVRQQETAAAEEWFKRSFQAEEVRGVDLQMEVVQQASYPVYVPAYVFSRMIPPSTLEQFLAGLQGQSPPPSKLHVLVSGYTPNIVAGSKVYDPGKVAAVAGVISPAVLWFSGFIVLVPGPKLLFLGMLLPALIAATIARHSHQLRLVAASATQQAKQRLPSYLEQLLGPTLSRALGLDGSTASQQQQQQASKGSSERLEDEWVRAYTRQHPHSQQSSRGSWSSSSSSRGSSWSGGQSHSSQRPSGSVTDPRGYYQVLGVKRGASLSEVQEAFRSKALQRHPDRFTDPAEKNKATVEFQKISEAYSVLRNPTKRAAYDSGGHA